MSFVFEKGVRVEESDRSIDWVEGSVIVNEELYICCNKRRRSSFISDVCSCRDWVRAKINEVNCNFEFKSEMGFVKTWKLFVVTIN